ncbi:hypothetical protein HMPREF3207_01283 [Citrobacter koseri]|nr:hypothetical protein HMPREF3207_01283 [Citrobacter koseri]
MVVKMASWLDYMRLTMPDSAIRHTLPGGAMLTGPTNRAYE